jgi:alpha-galactosidase
LKSPLIVGTNLQTINESSLQTLLNRDIIAISQDDSGVAVDYVPGLSSEQSIQVWAGPLSSGRSKFVILAFNEKNSTQNITIPLAQVPRYASSVSGAVQVLDVWAQKNLGRVGDKIQLANVGVHETKVLLFSSL